MTTVSLKWPLLEIKFISKDNVLPVNIAILETEGIMCCLLFGGLGEFLCRLSSVYTTFSKNPLYPHSTDI